MRPVQAASIETAIRSLSGVKGVEEALTYLDRVQPKVPKFSMQAMRQHDSQFGITALLVCFFVVRAFEQESDSQLPVCDSETLAKCWENNLHLFQQGGSDDHEKMLELMALEDANQRTLQLAARNLLMPTLQKNMTDRTGQVASLQTYFVVKTVIDAIDSITD